MSSPESNAIIGRLRGNPRTAPSPSENGGATKRQKGIASVETAIALVRIIEQAGQPLALKEIAALADQSTAATHHYLVSLIRTGLISQHPASGHYELGTYSLQLGLAALGRMDLIEIAATALTSLRNQTGESCFLSVWGSHGATIVKYIEGIHTVTVEVRLGLVLPLISSATGSVFLSWLSNSALSPVLEQEHGANTPAQLATIEKIRKKVRKDGMGITQGGVLPRISALACPIFDHDGRLAGALTILGWNDELDVSKKGHIAQTLIRTAAEVSSNLGYMAPTAAP